MEATLGWSILSRSGNLQTTFATILRMQNVQALISRFLRALTHTDETSRSKILAVHGCVSFVRQN